MKSNSRRWLWLLSILFLFSCVTPRGTITKGALGEQDIHRWDGTSSKTFTRATSTGGTLTLNDFGYEVDVLISYGGGVSYTRATIETAKAAVGTSNLATFLMRPGAWTITDDTTITSNIALKVPAGASFTISTGKTLTINGPFEAGQYQVFTLQGTGTVRFGRGSVPRVVPQWWGASVTATAASNSVAFQAWLDSVGTYPPIPLHIPGITLSSSSAYQINTALTKTSADWIRLTGDGPSSWLEWTGADYGTILSLTGAGSGNAVVDSVRFDCNDKATTGLSLAGFGHGISVTKCEFNDGLANVADNQGMLDIPLNNETHNGLIQRNYFGGGTAIGIGLGLTGVASASGGFDVSVNEFQQINNWAIKAHTLKESGIRTNIVDGNASHVNGGGFYLDIASGLSIDGNHMETLDKSFLSINPTSRYTFRPATGTITNNMFLTGGVVYVTLGSTDDMVLAGNTSLNTGGVMWLSAATDAVGTIVGKNTYSSALTGSMSWAEQYISGAGLINQRYSQTTVAPDTAVLTLTSQSSSVGWVSLTPISTAQNPNIPADARGYVLHVSIKSATVGARLWMVNEGNAPLWANRTTDMRVQYIEAQTANRYNTGTFVVPVKNTSFQDSFQYGLSDCGSLDTDVEIRVVGYLMPT